MWSNLQTWDGILEIVKVIKDNPTKIMNNQTQKPVQTQAIKSISATNSLEVSNPISAIATQTNPPATHSQQNKIAIPPSPPVNLPTLMPEIVSNPNVQMILACAVLIRVILDRPTLKTPTDLPKPKAENANNPIVQIILALNTLVRSILK